MRITAHLLLALSATTFATGVFAQENSASLLSLEEALDIALTHNPAMQAAEFERRAAEQERRAAVGLRMPQIGVSGAYTYLGKDIGLDFNDMKAPYSRGSFRRSRFPSSRRSSLRSCRPTGRSSCRTAVSAS